jgi:hypothetical protein
MKIRDFLFTSAAVLFSAASISAAAVTTSAHTWVSGSGSDANACTFASPCATFQGALAKTSVGGLITAMDAGDFGFVNIAQSVTIDGSHLGSITYTGNDFSNAIRITPSVNVTLQNLTINGMGNGHVGIYVLSGGNLIVHNCLIENFTYDGILFTGAGTLVVENSRIESFSGTGSDIGIQINASGMENVVVRNTIIDATPLSAGNNGFLIYGNTGPVTASLQNVTIMGAGGYAVYSANGVTEITGSVLTQSLYGVYAGNGATISVASSMITANTTGVCSGPSSKIRLDNNDIYDNSTAIDNCGGIVKTSGTNKTSGTIAIPASDVSNSVTF